MTAKEHNADITLNTDTIDGFSKLYNSLDEGDKLVIKDTISNIYYDNKIDETRVIFGWTENDFLEISFEGYITDIYSLVDEVEITVTIKYVNFTYEEFNYEMEIYEEQWVSEEFFRTDSEAGGDGFKPLPQNRIKKA